MQRKNNLLMPIKSTARSGFAMIMAIIVLIVIGGLMAFSLSLVAQTGKRTTDIYLYEQAVLVSKSAAELALLDIAQNGPCFNTPANLNYRMDLNGDGNTNNDIYDVNVTLKYVYSAPSPCGVGNVNNYFENITTEEQNGSVLMDITVTTNEGTEPIRYFRRSIQKL